MHWVRSAINTILSLSQKREEGGAVKEVKEGAEEKEEEEKDQ